MLERRIVFVDAARGLAVALALYIHSLATFGAWYHLPRLGQALVRLVTSAATPTFIVLFGAMLEMVYYPGLVEGGRRRVRVRLLRRSWNCYVAYLAVVAASVVGGRRGMLHGVAAALSLGDAQYGNILKFYAFALVLAIPLLGFRQRRGLLPTVLLGLAPWVAVAWLDRVSWPPPSSDLSYLSAMLVGRPIGRSWISLLHSQALVVTGMTIGWSLSAGSGEERGKRFRRTATLILLAALAASCAVVLAVGPRDAFGGYTTLRYRASHHVGYYAFGLVEATALLIGLSLLLPPRMAYRPGFAPFLCLGRSSLLAFTLGNCLLDFWPRAWELPVTTGLVASALVPACVMCIVLLVESRLFEPAAARGSPAPAAVPRRLRKLG